MTKTEFIEFVQQQSVLDESRKKDLIDNVDWLTDEEREFLVKQISETSETLQRNEQKAAEELGKIHQVLLQFQKEELPKLAKKQESSEHESEQEAAENLLKNL